MSTPSIPDCPHGDTHCPINKELCALREKVEQLSSQVNRDFLTGLFNRQHMNTALEQEIERTQRSLQPTSLILIDADHFKHVNDTYGHVIGDKVIVLLAEQIRASVRKIDIACRYGGEEFAVILPSTAPAMGRRVAERIRENIERNALHLEAGERLHLTASIGVASIHHSRAINAEQFLELADEQLYKAKHEGRNRVAQAPWKTDNSTVSSEEKDALFGPTSGDA